MGYEIPRQYYSGSLKREALRRIRIEEKSLEQVAQELGLSTVRLTQWLDPEGSADAPELIVRTLQQARHHPLV